MSHRAGLGASQCTRGATDSAAEERGEVVRVVDLNR